MGDCDKDVCRGVRVGSEQARSIFLLAKGEVYGRGGAQEFRECQPVSSPAPGRRHAHTAHKHSKRRSTSLITSTMQINAITMRHLTAGGISSVAHSCPTLCNPMDCSTPGLPVHHQLLEFTQTHVHRVGDAIQPSHPLSSPSPPAFNLSPASGSFRMSQLFASRGQSIGASASASVLPMNIQD